MRVVLAEKPSVARELAAFLGASARHDGYFEGRGYQVTWALGHLGTLKEPAHEGHGEVRDLNWREIATLAPILTLCLWLGVYPQPVIETMRPDVQIVANILQKAQMPATRGIAQR